MLLKVFSHLEPAGTLICTEVGLPVVSVGGLRHCRTDVFKDFTETQFDKSHVCISFRDCYTEKCVMNNYFGIGLDAKISLDFNNKRDEHPEKCRYSKKPNCLHVFVAVTEKEIISCLCPGVGPRT